MNSTLLTYRFLFQLSSHLASRKGLSDSQYIVCIGYRCTTAGIELLNQLGRESNEDVYSDVSVYSFACQYLVSLQECVRSHDIQFCPDVTVYPSTHLRTKAAKQTVVDHVVTHHMPELAKLNDADPSDVRTEYNLQNLVSGIYLYRASLDAMSRKYRRWVRIF